MYLNVNAIIKLIKQASNKNTSNHFSFLVCITTLITLIIHVRRVCTNSLKRLVLPSPLKAILKPALALVKSSILEVELAANSCFA